MASSQKLNPQNGVPIGGAPLHYAKLFYQALVAKAQTEALTSSDDDSTPVEVLVFRGKLSDVFSELKLHQNYYTKIRTILVESGAVEYVQRGTRGYDSILLLNGEPPDDFTLEGLTNAEGGHILPSSSELEPRLAKIESDLAGLKNWREALGGLNILEAFKAIEHRLNELESKVNNGEAA